MKRLELTMLFCVALAGMPVADSALAAKLPTVFGDHMVLQRDAPVPVWGWAEPGEKVLVKVAGQEAQATPDDKGEWRVKLQPMTASTRPTTLTVSDGKGTITISNVLIGDVWLCSGQSNMAFELSQCNRPEDVQGADFPLIRHFEIPEPRETPSEPRRDLVTRAFWNVCSPQTVPRFAAVGQVTRGGHLRSER